MLCSHVTDRWPIMSCFVQFIFIPHQLALYTNACRNEMLWQSFKELAALIRSNLLSSILNI
ncbi:CLUMA_CG006710, isoform A [Clunio marinus]|uniref:CLUMA_CG006710, isoform A n=1 Tax=Clunio marinus TaxID=568069 RepID=A0A1J1HY69_9DIPT|nr:CLUMA_CG006710, isoform A [Clunio marinus]